ncbi:2-oxo-hepta-3-ene-1,7-dioic acid hydratase [Ramlibacter terrae]|uniref:2-oxo-hepta-3-ene-1,7-dioic acid hydratase n=1 Tax=Ramlibacter terrae TaxID=2732511 RepID=A0ABX6P1N7_9BURK|nr:2-oxo-hepta-3-ene-1,7-dioic acid hydratase [Ramlibacter terrae]
MQVEHFSVRFPAMTVADGYAVSRAWVAMKIAEGRKVRGHKIGLTSRAMQVSSQIDEPDYGTLLDDMFFEPGDIPTDRFIAPRVEVELAFVLKHKLEGDQVEVEDVLAATEYVTPAIEIIDARIEQFDRHTKAMRRVQDTISDNAANAGIILGRAQGAPARSRPAVVRGDPAAERRGRGNRPAAGVQGHPAVGVAWLARKLAPRGESLQAGEVVLAGSFTRPVAAKRGDVFDADYGPLGRFEFKFS